MNFIKKHFICILLVVTASAASFAYAIFFVLPLGASGVARSPDQYSIFYRTPEELAADGVEPFLWTRPMEEAVHRSIRTYYATEYKKAFQEETERALEERNPHSETQQPDAWIVRATQQLKASDAAAVPTSVYDKPRTYQGLEGIMGVFALANLYDVELGHFGGGAHLFFFRIDGKTPRIEKAFLVGEGPIFEQELVERFKIEMAKDLNP